MPAGVPAGDLNSKWLRQLDLGLLMGGPRFRPALHAALQALQEPLDPATSLASGGNTRPAKRQRTCERCSSRQCAAGDNDDGTCLDRQDLPIRQACCSCSQPGRDQLAQQGCSSGQQAAGAEKLPGSQRQVPLPPGSMSNGGASIAVVHLPSLEQFLVRQMQPGVPAVVTGVPLLPLDPSLCSAAEGGM